MTQRSVTVAHLLIPRTVKKAVQFLFFPHARWHDAAADQPLLSLPVKKVAGPALEGLDAALSALFREDLGLPEAAEGPRKALRRSRLRLVSPALRTPTAYTLAPVLAEVPPRRHAQLARRLRGAWLTPAEALRHPELSPTARRVLQRAGATLDDWLAPAAPTSARDQAWTERLLAAQRGDKSLFGSLLEDMRPVLQRRLRACGWTRALASEPADVEDALADAACNALDHLGSFDPDLGGATTWLWSITRNCAVTLLRKRARHAAFSLSPDGDTAGDWLGSDALDPALLAESEDDLARARGLLAEALAGADPLDRRIWQMRFAEGRKYDDIAAELAMPLGSVATIIHRLRKKGKLALET
jgi:RNA polymerase sigma-70 factor (ECF subfamily)